MELLLCTAVVVLPSAWCAWIMLRGALEMARDREPRPHAEHGYLPLSPKWFVIGILVALAIICLLPLLVSLLALAGWRGEGFFVQ